MLKRPFQFKISTLMAVAALVLVGFVTHVESRLPAGERSDRSIVIASALVVILFVWAIKVSKP